MRRRYFSMRWPQPRYPFNIHELYNLIISYQNLELDQQPFVKEQAHAWNELLERAPSYRDNMMAMARLEVFCVQHPEHMNLLSIADGQLPACYQGA